MSFVLIIPFLLPTLISCKQTTILQKTCYNITCGSYKSHLTQCDHISHNPDPFTNECVAKCDDPCANGYCNFCYCYTRFDDITELGSFPDCERIVFSKDCSGPRCRLNPTKSCNGDYTHNPYHNYECLIRCDEGSCGKGGTCSENGHCVCYLGYRPDPTNPRICVKIPQNNTTVSIKSCHKGFKLSDDGECVPTCGDCKNGCCGTDGVCQCWENYEWDVASAACVMVKDDVEVPRTSCSDICSNGLWCLVNCQNGQNNTGDVGGLDANYNCGDTSLGEDMISETRHKTIITILACFTVILLVTMTVLIFITLKMKHALPLNQAKIKILFGGLG
ncbi:hypothetical protein QE152_g10359 [Popillia japonica]|uniref:Uncharacterized protein n=1 Tax=Popillia japonica TaxID=7064 RepID=A0AAW1LV07_POPJA